MPVYEYQCSQCGVRFERMQKFSDEPVKVCPECNGEVHRLIHPAGIIFKGSGFYVNDSRSSRQNLSAPKRDDTSAGTSDDKSASKSTDSNKKNSSAGKASADSSD